MPADENDFWDSLDLRLTNDAAPSPHPARQVVLASHLVLTGYAHWLPNELRGSGSEQIRKDELKPLGEILPGRQFPQPPREAVREFHRAAEPLLEHPVIWFDEAMRNAIAKGFADAARAHGYTLWACAICSNHAHVIPRTHRHRAEVIWSKLANGALLALRGANLVPANHPVWSHRPYKVFLHAKHDVLGRIDYVNDNPGKEGLPWQQWGFVRRCPFDKR